MRQPTVQEPDVYNHALFRAIERETASLMAGIRVLIARSGLARSAAEIEATADDTLQEVVLKAMERGDDYDESRPVRPWLMKFALNHIRNLRSRQKRQRGIVTPVAETGQVRTALAASSGHRANEISEADMFDLLEQRQGSQLPGNVGWSVLLSLASEEDREILTLRHWNELEFSDIARALKIATGTARVRHHRALERLRQAYEQSERLARGEASDA